VRVRAGKDTAKGACPSSETVLSLLHSNLSCDPLPVQIMDYGGLTKTIAQELNFLRSLEPAQSTTNHLAQ